MRETDFQAHRTANQLRYCLKVAKPKLAEHVLRSHLHVLILQEIFQRNADQLCLTSQVSALTVKEDTADSCFFLSIIDTAVVWNKSD